MDIISILSLDERIIVLTSPEDRSVYTWNQSDTFQCWRPVVRVNESDYPNGQFDPNDWEEVAIMTKSGHGPKSYADARDVALAWHNGPF